MPDPQEWLEAYQNAPSITGRELLLRAGFEPLPAEAVDDFQLSGRLWEFIYALAARRIYLHATNHLSDRSLYVWLHDQCLAEDTLDVPPEMEWSFTIDLTASGTEADNQVFLRYYADECERARWAESFPEDTLPAHEPFPFDRDRYLPSAPQPPREVELSSLPDLSERSDEPGETPFDTPETRDPLGLNEVDREIRREQCKADPDDADSWTGQQGDEGGEPLETVTKMDEVIWQRPLDELARAGVQLLPPDELTDETVGAKLWILFHELACRGFYVVNTDHLGDREAYTSLWREVLREPAILPGRGEHGGWLHDFVGSGSEEDTQVWLRCFASDEARARHELEWPMSTLPPRETPRFKRDWRLPKGPF